MPGPKLSDMVLFDRRVKHVWSGMVVVDALRRGDPRSPGSLRPKRKYHRRKAIIFTFRQFFELARRPRVAPTLVSNLIRLSRNGTSLRPPLSLRGRRPWQSPGRSYRPEPSRRRLPRRFAPRNDVVIWRLVILFDIAIVSGFSRCRWHRRAGRCPAPTGLF